MAGHPRTVIIAQARMGSTRLPGKVMMDICGKPMVDRVIERAQRSQLADALVVAIPDMPEDDVLAEYLAGLGATVVRGSADDVLARYVRAAEATTAESIVRITCDCPLIDPEIIDLVIAAFHESGVDYCSNTLERTYPIGMDTEVFSREALDRAHAEATLPHEREHVTPYLYQHPELFKLHNVEAPEGLRHPELRLTVDEQADLEMVNGVCARVPSPVRLQDVVRAVLAYPELRRLNEDVRHRYIDR